jgi:integrase
MNKSIRETGRSLTITIDQCKSLLSLASSNLRDYTLFFLTYHYAMRVSEVIRLRVEDIVRDQINIPVVKTKNRKAGKGEYHDIQQNELPERYEVEPLTEQAKIKIDKYLKYYDIKSGWLFPVKNTHISKLTVQRLFYKYCSQLDIKASIHSLRHCRLTYEQRTHGDLERTKRVGRHKSISSTERYLHMTLDELKEAREDDGL